jgi:hypothetical protein
MDMLEFGCPPFFVTDLKDFPALVGAMTNQASPVSAFLWRTLPTEEQTLLITHPESGAGLRKAEDVVVQALNDVIETGEPGIYDRDRFQGVSLRPETIDLLKKNPSGPELSRLNRLLLEDACSTELSRSADLK